MVKPFETFIREYCMRLFEPGHHTATIVGLPANKTNHFTLTATNVINIVIFPCF